MGNVCSYFTPPYHGKLVIVVPLFVFQIEEHLKNLKCANSMEELRESWQVFAPEVVSLMRLVHKRQMVIWDAEKGGKGGRGGWVEEGE